jgi:pSer/pThr/pTyr-binding forkhead associated (FHA) protein
MAYVTLQLLEGLERGQVLENLPTPVTIGREEENTLRLNDERISRFHAKIQDDDGKFILTDLDSTNGTRVNGHPIQMRVLQIGDQISIGRCLLVFGSEAEIAARFEELLKDRKTLSDTRDHTVASGPGDGENRTRDRGAENRGELHSDEEDQPLELFPSGPPDPPLGMKPAQRAQVSDFIAYCHEQVRHVLLASAEAHGDELGASDADAQRMLVDGATWQRLLRLELQLAVYMRRIADPDAPR